MKDLWKHKLSSCWLVMETESNMGWWWRRHDSFQDGRKTTFPGDTCFTAILIDPITNTHQICIIQSSSHGADLWSHRPPILSYQNSPLPLPPATQVTFLLFVRWLFWGGGGVGPFCWMLDSLIFFFWSVLHRGYSPCPISFLTQNLPSSFLPFYEAAK